MKPIERVRAQQALAAENRWDAMRLELTQQEHARLMREYEDAKACHIVSITPVLPKSSFRKLMEMFI